MNPIRCFCTAVALLFLCAPLAIGQVKKPPVKAPPSANQQAEPEVVYRIKIGAFKQVDTKKFQDLCPPKGSVYTEDAGNGLTRLLIGDYKTEADAQKALPAIQKAGYKDAFITARKLADKKDAGGNNSVGAATGGAKTPSATPADTTKYVVQLGLIKEADFNPFSNLTDLGQLYSEKNGDLLRVTLGNFVGREAANKATEEVRKRGHATAFPRKLQPDSVNKNDKPIKGK